MGLYDTVPAFGLKQDNDMSNIKAFGMNLDVSNSNFTTIVHAVAVNENRTELPVGLSIPMLMMQMLIMIKPSMANTA